MKDLVILNLNKAVHFNMERAENDLDIYYAVGNANTQRQESEIAAIINKRTKINLNNININPTRDGILKALKKQSKFRLFEIQSNFLKKTGAWL